jgi:hypothetical protein
MHLLGLFHCSKNESRHINSPKRKDLMAISFSDFADTSPFVIDGHTTVENRIFDLKYIGKHDAEPITLYCSIIQQSYYFTCEFFYRRYPIQAIYNTST